MSTQEHYAAVLKDLEEEKGGIAFQREELAAQLETLDRKEQELGHLIEQLKERSAAKRGEGPYSGLGILEATVALLTEHGSPMLTDDITDAIIAGGVESKAANPKTTVYGVLHREDGKGGIVAKVGSSKWGLREWQKEAQESDAESAVVADMQELVAEMKEKRPGSEPQAERGGLAESVMRQT